LKNLGIRRFAFVRRVLLILRPAAPQQGSLSAATIFFSWAVSELETGRDGAVLHSMARAHRIAPAGIFEKKPEAQPTAGRERKIRSHAPSWRWRTRERETFGRHSGFFRHRHRACPRDFCGRMITNRFSRRNSHRPFTRPALVAVFYHRPPALVVEQGEFSRTAASSRANTVFRRVTNVLSARGSSARATGAGGWKPRPRERPQASGRRPRCLVGLNLHGLRQRRSRERRDEHIERSGARVH